MWIIENPVASSNPGLSLELPVERTMQIHSANCVNALTITFNFRSAFRSDVLRSFSHHLPNLCQQWKVWEIVAIARLLLTFEFRFAFSLCGVGAFHMKNESMKSRAIEHSFPSCFAVNINWLRFSLYTYSFSTLEQLLC